MLESASEYVIAAGGLGTSAFALVDASKALWGGVSNCGFTQIERVVIRLLPGSAANGPGTPLSPDGALSILKANWLNGVALADQKAIAKTLTKLRLIPANAAHLASATGVDEATLRDVAGKIAAGESLSKVEADVFGRFDLIVTALLDEGYQRADQIYRNSAKAWAAIIAVVLAFFGGWAVSGGPLTGFLWTRDMGAAILTGLIATPLAPISKDLATAISAGVQNARLLRK